MKHVAELRRLGREADTAQTARLRGWLSGCTDDGTPGEGQLSEWNAGSALDFVLSAQPGVLG